MQRSLEQRYAIKFCAKLGKSGSETLQLLRTAYGDAVLSLAQVFRWHKAFKDGRENIEEEQHAGHPSTSRTENNVARVKAVLDRDWRLNVQLITEEAGLHKTDVHRIITEDLHTRKICAKLVPKNLSDVWEFLAQNNITMLPHPPYSRHDFVRFLFILQAQNPPQRTSILGQLKTFRHCDEGFEHLKWRLPPLLWRVAAMLESLYSITRSLFWRG